MTTIAFDGVKLAADRGSWTGGFHQQGKKVHRVTAPDGRKAVKITMQVSDYAARGVDCVRF